MNIEISPRTTSSTASRRLVIARTGLTIAALVLASCTADDLTQAVSTPSATPRGEQQCAGDTSPHTISLKDADGNAFQLVHCRGSGWKHVAEGSSNRGEGKPSLRKIDFSPVATAQAGTISSPTEEPMAVFIDGPTGYAFAWTSDGGWKFVGHVTDESR